MLNENTQTNTNESNQDINYFDVIAGYHQEKKMMENLANLIKNRAKLKLMGGRLPKGLLLLGRNGLGKTVLAKAFIKTAKVYTVTLDCASFESSNFKRLVQDKFKEASIHTPSIIFIDELDKITGSNNFATGANFEHFKDLLNTMNQYMKCEDLFILGCANPDYDIDTSLVRSGRIDRIVNLDYPSQSEREEIFAHFANNKKLDKDVDFKRLAQMTNELTGADIEVIMNESAIEAFNNNRDYIKSSDIEKAIADKRFGPMEKDNEYNDASLKIVAAHEAGHALVAMVLTGKVLNRLTVSKRGSVSGYAETLFNEEKVVSLKDMYDKAVVCLAGREAEKVFYDTYFVGASSDIRKAQQIINLLVTRDGLYGLDKLVFTISERRMWPNQHEDRKPSELKTQAIEACEDSLLTNASNLARNIIIEHIDLAHILINELMEKKTLTKDELDVIYENYFHKHSSGIENFAEKYIYKDSGYVEEILSKDK